MQETVLMQVFKGLQSSRPTRPPMQPQYSGPSGSWLDWMR